MNSDPRKQGIRCTHRIYNPSTREYLHFDTKKTTQDAFYAWHGDKAQFDDLVKKGAVPQGMVLVKSCNMEMENNDE